MGGIEGDTRSLRYSSCSSPAKLLCCECGRNTRIQAVIDERIQDSCLLQFGVGVAFECVFFVHL